MTFSLGSHHFQLSLAAIAGAAIVLFTLLHFGGPNLPLDRWLGGAKQEISTDRKLLAQDALHQRQAAAGWKRLRDSTGRVLALATVLRDSGLQLLAAAQTPAQQQAAGRVLVRSDSVCLDGLTLCRARGDSLQRADSAHADSLHHALQAADTSLQRGVDLVECHLVHVGPLKLFGCPSRVRSFEVGAGVGAALVYWLTHR